MITLIDAIWALFIIVVCVPVLIVIAYLITRAASIAHFRSRMEHFRSVLRELRKGETDG